MDIITMEHGSGGSATGKLIEEIFVREFANDNRYEMEDAAVVCGAPKIAITTDNFVVTPVEYPGGNIGRLCVCGTVNDLLMRGASPQYITCGFILQEGVSVEVLKRIVKSLKETADEAGVTIVAGDTKVIEGNGQIMINTAGVGTVDENIDISAAKSREGDAILVSGNLGEHHAAILGSRMNIDNTITSDNAPLNEMVYNLLKNKIEIHALRDVTRGGLATVLKELAESSGLDFEIEEDDIPVTSQVKDFCGLLGLDPLYMGNEGKLVATLPHEQAQRALSIIKSSKYGENAAIIGSIKGSGGNLYLRTSIGGRRALDLLTGEGLPRIC